MTFVCLISDKRGTRILLIRKSIENSFLLAIFGHCILCDVNFNVISYNMMSKVRDDACVCVCETVQWERLSMDVIKVSKKNIKKGYILLVEC